MKTTIRNLLAAAVLGAGLSSVPVQAAEDWSTKTIAPVVNPVFFEDPFIRNEVRPLFIYQRLSKTLPVGGTYVPVDGDVRVYAMEVRWAVTDRLAIIATKDGYIEFNPKSTLAKADGWADISLGLKYAVIDDRENQLIVTPGIELELPTGNRRVFQGNGQGEWDVFVSAAKGWGDFSLTGNLGARVPNNMFRDTAQLHASVQAAYHVCRYFIPFVAANSFTVLNSGGQLATKVEGFDLINFGSSQAAGKTQAVVGGGFRSKLNERFELGLAYEKGVTHPTGVFDDRFTLDLIWHF